MRLPTRRTAITVALLSLSLAATDHVLGTMLYLDRLDTDRTPLTPLTTSPPASPTPSPTPSPTGQPALPLALPVTGDADPLVAASLPRARQLVLVLCDGLRDDVADALPGLRSLAARGARRTLVAELPSYTFPNLTAMATGVPPAYSGVRFNTGRAHVPVDTLLMVFDRHDRPARIVSEWDELDSAFDRLQAPRVPHLDLPSLLAAGPLRDGGIDVVYLGDVDEAGHSDGAASEKYAAAARHVDAIVTDIAAHLDLSRDVLVALSDHGHLSRGGHGGVEAEVRSAFFVAVGASVKAGVRLPDRATRDVASTLALLAGLPPPRDSLGAPMLDLLALDDGDRARAFAPAVEQRARREDRLEPSSVVEGARLRSLLTRLRAGEAGAIAPAEATLAARSDEREGWLMHEARLRALPRLATTLVLLGLALWLRLRAHRRQTLLLSAWDLLPLCVYATVFASLYLAFGYHLGWSIRAGAKIFVRETGIAGAVAGVAMLAVGRVLAWRQRSSQVAQSAASLVPGAAFLLAIAATGLDPAWLASPVLSYVPVLLAVATFYAEIALGLGALVAACVRRR